ncbi:MAG: hypothetical protein HY569_02620 [Candidatus Magasanikbacteria bacterium]|nr:hypothetical protein [Candidatus Magasanikbacteria bacterium]
MGNSIKYFVIISISAGFAGILAYAQSVQASENAAFLTYYNKCSCKYSQQTSGGGCYYSEEELEIGLGETQDITFQGNDESIKFSKAEDCEDLLQFAVDQKKVCVTATTPKCQLYHAVTYTDTNGATMYDWVKWYNLKWATNVGGKSNPIPVTEGQIATAEIEAVGTKEEIKIDCVNCEELSADLKNEKGNGKAKIVWDTSTEQLITKVYELKVKASVPAAGAESQILDGSIYFSVTGVSPVQTTSTVDAWIKSQYGVPPGYVERGGALPPCAFSGTCRSVNDLLQLIINFASGMFAILGTFAFAFFVYGGFKMIASMGNAEMVETGKKTMIAAAIGLAVSFSAYMAIGLMLKILDVSMEFRGIK